MSYQKPRIMNDWKDLFWSLFPLVLICLVIAGIASQCTFSAKGPTPGQIPDFDVSAALADDAANMPFAIREPALPEGWTPNSGHRDTIAGTGGGPVSTVGYITPQGTYMQLSQTDATEEALAKHVVDTRYATGTEQIGDRKWVVYAEPGTETAWITDFGDSRVLIKGAGNPAAYTTLATAIGRANPL
ncbi:DUF4245 domain-containing protein [Nocardia otitidiscaviarum]|nr:DUF4245 domain-containing protein [Nocardia otitidiscaviarum]MBF6131706.1 DUF4245 domain-containing protein [Nocardia otitidiscaviarum]MBF6482838.1 DUF4245 domain-containing protein [Nocardia otitidiscaviarum]